MSKKLYLKDIATHLIKNSVESLFNGERGNDSLNGSSYHISKEGWKHKKGFYQSFIIDTVLSVIDENCVTCFIDNTGDDCRNRSNTNFHFYKERNKEIEELEKRGLRVIPYSEISSFEITDNALREAFLSWGKKWSNNHIAPFADEAINEPHQWFLVERIFYENKNREEKIISDAFDTL